MGLAVTGRRRRHLSQGRAYMDAADLIGLIQSSTAGEWMRSSVKAMPIVESLHVMAIAVVFGSILIVDLRLLGLADARRPFARLSAELLPWTWSAFTVAVITGALMFSANAVTYFGNTAFRLKLVALAAAGINMAVFEYITLRRMGADAITPLAGRLAGAASILIWISVIVLGRWIGFTKGYDFTLPADTEINFEFGG